MFLPTGSPSPSAPGRARLARAGLAAPRDAAARARDATHRRAAAAALVLASASFLGGCCAAGSPPPVALGPGFSPQPMTATGLAGGAQVASTLSDGCLGNVPMSPQHVLEITGPMANLTIMVQAHGADATLVVRIPDGTFRCNDDADGLNPLVRGPVGPGRVEVYVGAYNHDSTSAAYTVAFTEDAAAMPSAIP